MLQVTELVNDGNQGMLYTGVRYVCITCDGDALDGALEVAIGALSEVLEVNFEAIASEGNRDNDFLNGAKNQYALDRVQSLQEQQRKLIIAHGVLSTLYSKL